MTFKGMLIKTNNAKVSIMNYAWKIYKTLTGDHVAKISLALSKAHAYFKKLENTTMRVYGKSIKTVPNRIEVPYVEYRIHKGIAKVCNAGSVDFYNECAYYNEVCECEMRTQQGNTWKNGFKPTEVSEYVKLSKNTNRTAYANIFCKGVVRIAQI